MPFAKLTLDLFRAENRVILLDVFLLGTLGIVPAQLGLVLGVERTLASNASVLSLTVPVLTALSASLFSTSGSQTAPVVVRHCNLWRVLDLGQRYTQCKIVPSRIYGGNLLVLASCAGSAFNNSFSRRALSHFSPAQVLVWTFIVADLELLVIFLATDWGGWRQLRTPWAFGVVEPGLGSDFQPWSVNAALLLSDPGSGSHARRFVRLLIACIRRCIFGASSEGKVNRQFARGRAVDIRELLLVTVYEEKQRHRRTETHGSI